MKRSGPIKRRKRPNPLSQRKKNWTKVLDDLCRAVVFARDGNKCVRSGKTTQLQWCHVASRRYWSLRWDPDNSLCLNAGEHLKGHHNPLEFAAWFAATYPKRHAKILLVLKAGNRRPDLAGIKLWLEQELAKPSSDWNKGSG